MDTGGVRRVVHPALFSAMNESIAVNFHLHSIFSDGEGTPEALAASLAAAEVRFAALTDHDSLEGLPRFQEALKKRGVGCLPGVELTTQFHGQEAHLLGYGFDPQDPELNATLRSLRQRRMEPAIHSIASSMRRAGSNHPAGHAGQPATSAAPNGHLETGTAIALLHRAGGKAFLAHPLHLEPDLEKLEAWVGELKALGLDGLEVHYAPFSQEQRNALGGMAQRLGLLVSGGTDFHSNNGPGGHSHGVEIPREEWLPFRDALLAGAIFSDEAKPKSGHCGKMEAPKSGHKPPHFRLRAYALRILLPTLTVIALFLAAIWGIILPSFENTLLERKRELILELTNSAWSILASYENDVQNGLLEQPEAQQLAAARVETLRYGPDGKGYFWIQDLQPRMIMHPYRSDLNGQDLADFTDPRGVRIFVEFADLVRQEGQGYIDYVWQWNDDPLRLEAKQSFVKGFEPWGWVIGTGIYTEDVKAEIARLERSLIRTALAISGVVVVLLLFVLQQSLRIERERQEVVDSLHESTERYQSLVEATTEGTLLILEQRCRYANPTFLKMTGYSARQLEFLDLADLLPRSPANEPTWRRVESATGGLPTESEAVEGILKDVGGHSLECLLTLNPIVFAGQDGFILLARELSRREAALGEEYISQAAMAASVGIFRARAIHRGTLIGMNPAVKALLPPREGVAPALADFFQDEREFEAFLQELKSSGEVCKRRVHVEGAEATRRTLALSARLVRDEHDGAVSIDGTLEDITARRAQEVEREALIEKLQASLLFLHEPIARLGSDAVLCDLQTSIAEAARRMTKRNASAALVTSGGEESAAVVIGIVSDHDLRARVLAGKVAPEAPIHTVMSAPITRIPASALVYEALMRMEDKGVHHLAVEDPDGRIVGVIEYKALVQFQRYGPIVLGGEIARADSPAEVAQCTRHTAPLVWSLLNSGARPRIVTSMLASTCDAATERLIALATGELGPPPAPFAFIAMGSQGRQEQTLVTDQDNGIIHAAGEGEHDAEKTGAYFLRLGEMVCAGLEQAGYAFCRGGVMANQPRWCRSLPEWIRSTQTWIQEAEPQEIIDLNIFFDLRTVHGDPGLTHALRSAMYAALAKQPAVFHHLAASALQFKPPFRLAGNIYLGGGSGEHSGEINLKEAMMPMVSFARLYALRHQVSQTHTLERIEALCERGFLQASSRDEISAGYDFLMQLRLRNQSAAIQEGRTAQNSLHPGRLSTTQQELLKQAFTQIAAVQKKIGYDFPGTG